MATQSIVTNKFRLAFPAIFEPEKNNLNTNGKEKYAITMLFPKGTDLDALKKLAKDAVAEKWPDPNKRPKNIRYPFRDGDEVDWDGFEGNVFIKASSLYRPGVVNQKVKPVLDPEEIYAGCYCRAEVNAFAYDTQGNKGVSFGLQNVQKVAEGDRFGGRKDPEKVFGAVEQEADDDPNNYDNDDLFGEMATATAEDDIPF